MRLDTPAKRRNYAIGLTIIGVCILIFGRGIEFEGTPLVWRGWMLLGIGIAVALVPGWFEWCE